MSRVFTATPHEPLLEIQIFMSCENHYRFQVCMSKAQTLTPAMPIILQVNEVGPTKTGIPLTIYKRWLGSGKIRQLGPARVMRGLFRTVATVSTDRIDGINYFYRSKKMGSECVRVDVFVEEDIVIRSHYGIQWLRSENTVSSNWDGTAMYCVNKVSKLSLLATK